ncbi:hypothetical protein C8R43DRAFT_975184 [Mycena crocata]|nr:hypothetical protein C8R43DRAFT_975184 [Mycena crocata]
MFSRIIATTLAALALAAMARAAPVALDPRTASDPFSACGPPKNEKHKAGDSCKFKQAGATLHGTCISSDNTSSGSLFCFSQDPI